jgi:hypothetical protein
VGAVRECNYLFKIFEGCKWTMRMRIEADKRSKYRVLRELGRKREMEARRDRTLERVRKSEREIC